MASGTASKEDVLAAFRKELLQHREQEAKLKRLREELVTKTKEYEKSEEDLKAVQGGVGQIIGKHIRNSNPLSQIIFNINCSLSRRSS